MPRCRSGEGVGEAGITLESFCVSPHLILCQRVDLWGRKEKGNDGGVAHICCGMQERCAILQ